MSILRRYGTWIVSAILFAVALFLQQRTNTLVEQTLLQRIELTLMQHEANALIQTTTKNTTPIATQQMSTVETVLTNHGVAPQVVRDGVTSTAKKTNFQVKNANTNALLRALMRLENSGKFRLPNATLSFSENGLATGSFELTEK